MLIVGRAVAGVGAAALFSGGMTIIGYAVPLRKRAIYIACISSMYGIASIVGPILGIHLFRFTVENYALTQRIGGALTDKASWRWCFWVNSSCKTRRYDPYVPSLDKSPLWWRRSLYRFCLLQGTRAAARERNL